MPGSSSGRTEDSGSSNGGSNPSPGSFYYKKYLTMWDIFLSRIYTLDENHKVQPCLRFERERAESGGLIAE